MGSIIKVIRIIRVIPMKTFHASLHSVRQIVMMQVSRPGKQRIQLERFTQVVIMQVNHGNKGYGNVYVSGADGVKFTRSLSANVRAGSGECEFDKVSGLDGVQFSLWFPTGFRTSLDNLHRARVGCKLHFRKYHFDARTVPYAMIIPNSRMVQIDI